MRREIQVMSENTVLTVSTDRSRLRPWGVDGGGSGGNSSCTIKHANGRLERLAYSKMTQSLDTGDTVTISTPGAGGWGDPWGRDPQAVLWDVREEFISASNAAEKYGVLIRPAGAGSLEVDLAGTRALRAAHAAKATA
jgi:N-methylhydantoinase B